MTVSATTPYTQAFGNNSASTYSFDFGVVATSDLRVYVKPLGASENTLLVEGVDYTAVATMTGGDISLLDSYDPLPQDYLLTIVGDIPAEQDLYVTSGSLWNPVDVVQVFDKLTLEVAQLRRDVAACIKLPVHEFGGLVDLPDATLRADRVLGFDADGVLGMTGNFLPEGITVSAFSEEMIAGADAAAWLSDLGFTTMTASLVTQANPGGFFDVLGVTSFGQSLLAMEDASFLTTAIGMTTFGEQIVGTDNASELLALMDFSPFGESLTTAADAASARVILEVPNFTAFGAAWAELANAAAGIAALGLDTLGSISSQDADAVAITGGTIDGVDITGGTIDRMSQPVQSESSAAGLLTLDLADGHAFTVVLTQNINVVSITNVPPVGLVEVSLVLVQDAATPYTVTWASEYLFAGGTPHAMTAGLDAIDVLKLRTIDAGVTWFVSFEQDFS